jgi:hypothetical protein
MRWSATSSFKQAAAIERNLVIITSRDIRSSDIITSDEVLSHGSFAEVGHPRAEYLVTLSDDHLIIRSNK